MVPIDKIRKVAPTVPIKGGGTNEEKETHKKKDEDGSAKEKEQHGNDPNLGRKVDKKG